MQPVTITAGYYQQFDTDGSRDVPAEAVGGWKHAPLTFDLDRMALVVMHAVDCGTPDESPWLYRNTEYLRRARFIVNAVIGPLLSAVRGAGMCVYHVVPGGMNCGALPGYQRALSLAGPKTSPRRIEIDDPLMAALEQFRRDHVMPGAHNHPDPLRGPIQFGFPEPAAPRGDEAVAETSEQLFALCEADGINHLVYTGFTINWCIMTARGGMVDMSRDGLMCSAIREAVTAIENKESARTEAHKAAALWGVALGWGFVFEVDQFVRAVTSPRAPGPEPTSALNA